MSCWILPISKFESKKYAPQSTCKVKQQNNENITRRFQHTQWYELVFLQLCILLRLKLLSHTVLVCGSSNIDFSSTYNHNPLYWKKVGFTSFIKLSLIQTLFCRLKSLNCMRTDLSPKYFPSNTFFSRTSLIPYIEHNGAYPNLLIQICNVKQKLEWYLWSAT